MNLEKYTEKTKDILQKSQSLALRSSHQRLVPEHLLLTIIQDEDSTCRDLLQMIGVDSWELQKALDKALEKQPKVEGKGAGQMYMAPEVAKVLDVAEKKAEKNSIEKRF